MPQNYHAAQRAFQDQFVIRRLADRLAESTSDVISERFKAFTYGELIKRDKLNLDIFWLKDEALEDSANLPAPDIIAREIVDDLEAALEQFREIAEDLEEKGAAST